MNNYHLFGVEIPHVGYGRMILCLREALSKYVVWDERAGSAVYAVPPDMVKGWYDGQRTACLTMWETTKVPERYTRTLRMFDKVIVPCDHNAELFAPYHENISVVPLGINHDDWSPIEMPDNDRFRFVTGGSGWKRKGIGQIIQAFRDLNLPDADLYIKCTPDLLDDPKSYEFGPNIHVIKQTMTVEDERRFYASADCFVSATRGEGFGMIPLQNVALGNRVIAPAHTGHLMFSDLFDYQLDWDWGKASLQYFQEIGDWCVPKHDQLVDAMRDAYGKGRPPLWERQMRFEATLDWTWDRSARQLLEVFPPGGIVPQGDWLDAGGRKVRVRALRSAVCDVGQYHLRLVKDQEVYVPISTLMHLFECGLVTEL